MAELTRRSMDTVRQPGRDLPRDIAKGEATEKELDALITRRSRQKDPDEESDLWREGTRRYNARLLSENRMAWGEHHERMYRVHARLAAEHAAKADELGGAA